MQCHSHDPTAITSSVFKRAKFLTSEGQDPEYQTGIVEVEPGRISYDESQGRDGAEGRGALQLLVPRRGGHPPSLDRACWLSLLLDIALSRTPETMTGLMRHRHEKALRVSTH